MTATRNFDNGVTIRVGPWSIDFTAPNNALITPGSYLDATRFPFQDADEPGLSMSGDGRGHNELVGHFQVLDAAYGPAGEVLRFSADFEQRGAWAGAALLGKIRFNVVPEPSTFASVGIALGLILGRRRLLPNL
jgi:hypothetical protein